MAKGQLLAKGNTAEIFEYDDNKILKLYLEGISKSVCEQEFFITQNIHRLLGNCPKAYEVVHMEGRNGAIYERIEGQSMLKEMLSNLGSFKKNCKLLAHYHSALHQPIDFELPTIKDKLKRDIRHVKELTEFEKEKLYQYIDRLSDGSTLCHFDFHPDNIILCDGKAVIIDWMTACVGDCLSDVARTCILLKYSEVPIKSFILRRLIRFMQKRLMHNYLKEYIKITGANVEEIFQWELPIAAARLSEWRPEEEKKRLLQLVQKNI